jgi:hypothetical protein
MVPSKGLEPLASCSEVLSLPVRGVSGSQNCRNGGLFQVHSVRCVSVCWLSIWLSRHNIITNRFRRNILSFFSRLSILPFYQSKAGNVHGERPKRIRRCASVSVCVMFRRVVLMVGTPSVELELSSMGASPEIVRVTWPLCQVLKTKAACIGEECANTPTRLSETYRLDEHGLGSHRWPTLPSDHAGIVGGRTGRQFSAALREEQVVSGRRFLSPLWGRTGGFFVGVGRCI